MDSYDAVVIGAGPAGSAAAVALARLRHRVLLLEAEQYPVHKMCGEFLSPESKRSLQALGIADAIRARGAAEIRRVVVTSPSGLAWREALPEPALGISRWTLDPLLFDAALEAGADALQGARVLSVEGTGAAGFRVHFEIGGVRREVRARLVLGAYGKRARLDHDLGRRFVARRHDFVAFKAHHRGADLGDVVELHGFEGGYCGMSHVEDGIVNVCLIAWTQALREAGRSFEGLRDRTMRANRMLANRLDCLEPVTDQVVSISQIPFVFKELFARDVLMLGDSAGMIAPLCGDGMAMALRSAELAAPLASRFLSRELSFGGLKTAYTRAWRGEFAGRMRLGIALQQALFRPRLSRFGLGLLNRAPFVGRTLIHATRG